MKKGIALQFGMTTKTPFDRTALEYSSINAVGKPTGGIWLSPMAGEVSEWVRFCRKEMPDWIHRAHHYEVWLNFEGIRCYTEPPTKEELLQLLQDTECKGFFLIGIHSNWDVQSLWLKDASSFEKIVAVGREICESVQM